jgi:hypothetical protein
MKEPPSLGGMGRAEPILVLFGFINFETGPFKLVPGLWNQDQESVHFENSKRLTTKKFGDTNIFTKNSRK